MVHRIEASGPRRLEVEILSWLRFEKIKDRGQEPEFNYFVLHYDRIKFHPDTSSSELGVQRGQP